MCLELKKYARKKIAKEKIPCWIVVKVKARRPLSFKTYFREVEITPRMKSLLIKEYRCGDIRVNYGLHSFEFRDEALQWLILRRGYYNKTELRILDCYIPKGAEYYVGDFNGWSSFASDKRNLVKLLTSKKK